MLKCFDCETGSYIGDVEDWVAQLNENEYDIIHDDNIYSLKFAVNNVVFFVKQKQFNSTIQNNFSYHAPKEEQVEKYEEIRKKAKELAYLMEEIVANSHEKSLAMTNLEQAVFWANAGISRNG